MEGNKTTSSCVLFDTKNKSLREVGRIQTARINASCTVFEGKMVVTGGNADNAEINTVEAYDHIDFSWTNMPNMVETRSDYKTVAIKNKLFIVGGYFNTYIEVFDSCSNNFVLLKNTFRSLRHTYVSDITTLGNGILIFNNNNGYV